MTERDEEIQKLIDYLTTHKTINFTEYCKVDSFNKKYWNEIESFLRDNKYVLLGKVDGKLYIQPKGVELADGKYLEKIKADKEQSEIIKQKEERIDALTIANLNLQNEYIPHAISQASKWKTYYWIGIICSVLGTLLGVWLGNLQSDTPKQTLILDATPIHDTVYNTIYDTIYIPSDHRDTATRHVSRNK
jgi:hypothetical protein